MPRATHATCVACAAPSRDPHCSRDLHGWCVTLAQLVRHHLMAPSRDPHSWVTDFGRTVPSHLTQLAGQILVVDLLDSHEDRQHIMECKAQALVPSCRKGLWGVFFCDWKEKFFFVPLHWSSGVSMACVASALMAGKFTNHFQIINLLIWGSVNWWQSLLLYVDCGDLVW